MIIVQLFPSSRQVVSNLYHSSSSFGYMFIAGAYLDIIVERQSETNFGPVY